MAKLILIFFGLFVSMNVIILSIAIRSRSYPIAIVSNAIIITFMLVLLYLLR